MSGGWSGWCGYQAAISPSLITAPPGRSGMHQQPGHRCYHLQLASAFLLKFPIRHTLDTCTSQPLTLTRYSPSVEWVFQDIDVH